MAFAEADAFMIDGAGAGDQVVDLSHHRDLAEIDRPTDPLHGDHHTEYRVRGTVSRVAAKRSGSEDGTDITCR